MVSDRIRVGLLGAYEGLKAVGPWDRASSGGSRLLGAYEGLKECPGHQCDPGDVLFIRCL